MNKAHLDLLKKNYKDACNAFLKSFSDTYDVYVDEQDWVAGDVGTVVCINDEFYVSLDDIIYMLDNDVSWNEFLQWWDYCMNTALLGFNDSPNLKSWHKGCPRKIDKETMERLLKMKRDLDAEVERINSQGTDTNPF